MYRKDLEKNKTKEQLFSIRATQSVLVDTQFEEVG